ncbi:MULTISPECIES: phage major capsid protein [Microbacterium]|uniref:phage major capsid protein n=1 Tax=Microbacterium TaxID=33882 RepID=UPI00249E750E|nr:phage major capsid protein [Microbacterium sp. BDGP8]WHE35155.1 phage major capsid protein [Microbacterium sp. BDGP8]
MATSVQLRQERARTVEAMREITERAEGENRNLNADERTAYDRGETEFRDLSERIERQEAQERRNAEQGQTIGAGGDELGGSGTEAERRSASQRSAFLRFVRGASMAPEQRALVENAAGEILVPEDLEAEIIRAVPRLSAIRPIAGQRNTTSNRVRRRSLDEVRVGWGKLETNEQDLEDSMPDTPEEEWTYIEDLYGLAKIGEDELDDSDVNLEAFVRDSFAQAAAEAEDVAFTIGAGHTAHQPVGIFSTAGGVSSIVSGATDYSGASGANARNQILDDLKALIYGVPAQYRANGSFLLPSLTELHISTLKDGNGQYLWQASVQAGRPNTFLGYAMHNQDNIDGIAAGKAIAAFGDFARGYRVYDRQGVTVKRLEELYAEEGMIGFKFKKRVGGDVVRPQALKLLKTKASA